MMRDDRREDIIRNRNPELTSTQAQAQVQEEARKHQSPPPPSSPPAPKPPPPPPPPPPVKMPSRDVVNLIDSGIDIATMQNLLFENIGATELTQFLRHDTVDGGNQTYSLISNLSGTRKRYEPSALISSQKVDNSFYDVYSIKLESKIPSIEYLLSISLIDYVYFDNDGSLVIELINFGLDDFVEVELATSGTIYGVMQIDN